MAQHFRKLLWFANLMLSNPDGLTKREIDEAWERSGFSNPNQVCDFYDYGEVVSRISMPRTTMYRYIADVEDTFNLRIVCQKGTNLWSIDKSNKSHYGETVRQLREVISVLDAVNEDKNLAESIADVEPIYGIDDLNMAIEAIKNKKIVKLRIAGSPATLSVKPYGLRKFIHEWYLVGEEAVPAGVMASIGAYPLGAMHLEEVTDETFTMPKGFNIEEYYGDFVGPIVDFTIPNERIIIKADKKTGRHIDCHKIHHSQTLLDVGQDFMTFEYNLRPTESFYSEILKYGSQIQVLEPIAVREHIRREAEKIVAQNQ